MEPVHGIRYSCLLIEDARQELALRKLKKVQPGSPQVAWLWDAESVAGMGEVARALMALEEDPSSLVAALHEGDAAPSIHGAFPLDLALYRESLPFVKLLLEAGADPSEGRALLLASRADRPHPLLRELLDAGGTVENPQEFVSKAQPHVQSVLAAAWGVDVPARPSLDALDAADWDELHPRLVAVFDALEESGLYTWLHAPYTQGETLSFLPDGKDWCFITYQSMWDSSVCFVSFGSEDESRAAAVGKRVVGCFRAHGFVVDWDGSAGERIELKLPQSLSEASRAALCRGERTMPVPSTPAYPASSPYLVGLGLSEQGKWMSTSEVRKRSAGTVQVGAWPRDKKPGSAHCPEIFSSPGSIGHMELPVPVLHPWRLEAAAEALQITPREVRQIAAGIAGWRNGWIDVPTRAKDTGGLALRRALGSFEGLMDALPVLAPELRPEGADGDYRAILDWAKRCNAGWFGMFRPMGPTRELTLAVWRLLERNTQAMLLDR